VTEIKHRYVDVNGIRMHLAEAGAGPLVLFLHGFPETSHSWRHQLIGLAEAGYHAVAPDQRGYRTPRSRRRRSLHDPPPRRRRRRIDQRPRRARRGGRRPRLGSRWRGASRSAGRTSCAGRLAERPFNRVATSSRWPPCGPLRRQLLPDLLPGAGVAERELEGETADMFRKMFYWYSGDAPVVQNLICDENGMTGSLGCPRNCRVAVRRGHRGVRGGLREGRLHGRAELVSQTSTATGS